MWMLNISSSEDIALQSYLDYKGLHYDPDLEHSKVIFSYHTMAHSAGLQKPVFNTLEDIIQANITVINSDPSL